MSTVNFSMGEAATALRRELRDLVREHVPAGFLGAFTDDPADLAAAQRFCQLLAEKNLLCLAWPEEFGGRGASVWEQTVVREEMWAHHEPRGAQYMGVNWVGDGLLVVADTVPAAAVAHLDLRWAAVTLDGRRSLAVARPADGPPRGNAFVARLDLQAADHDGARDIALGLVLPCWTLLGMLDRAMELTRDHVLTREQFGQRLAAFQGVQFQLTEAEVERAGAEILARYALWSLRAGPDDAIDDALALRLAAIEAAEVVFRVAHQLHGAIGFCDETPLSWLSRYSQPLRRLPFGLSGTRTALTDRIGRRGLVGLFSGE